MLHQFMHQHGFKVLVLDVRCREEFEKGYIKADAIVNIEPSVLLSKLCVANSL
jgi:hypothetical protein